MFAKFYTVDEFGGTPRVYTEGFETKPQVKIFEVNLKVESDHGYT